VRRQLASITPNEDESVEIKSGFFKGAFGRYYATHFWPSEVTGNDVRETSSFLRMGERIFEMWDGSTRRGRWFLADATPFSKPGWSWEGAEEFEDDFAGNRRPLVGVDVSSSQHQILAIFCGMQSFERELVESSASFKVTLATEAWRRAADRNDDFYLPDGYTGPEDKRLQNAIKTALRNYVYGSELLKIADDLKNDVTEYGPGLGDAQNIERLLKPTQVWRLASAYLPVCKAAADEAHRRNPFAGFEFAEPYDGTHVRWNPIRRKNLQVGSGKTKLYVSAPVGRPNAAGDYRVNNTRWGDDVLRRKVAPCLAHVMDAMFAALVVERLSAFGVRDIVHIHDGWLVVSNAMPAVYKAVREVGEPWFRRLGPIYDAVARYLPAGTQHGDTVQGWRRQWERRVAEGKWPRFRVDRADGFWLGEVEPKDPHMRKHGRAGTT
jgi:hypothetical protein